jgi:hypothetical protein
MKMREMQREALGEDRGDAGKIILRPVQALNLMVGEDEKATLHQSKRDGNAM